jgi:hypothetical protein
MQNVKLFAETSPRKPVRELKSGESASFGKGMEGSERVPGKTWFWNGEKME